jgi:hypothetical protein
VTKLLEGRRSAGRLIQIVGRCISYGGVAVAAVALAFQCITWLRDGHWTSLRVSDVLLWSALQVSARTDSIGLMSWVQSPSSWLGLHYLASATPLVFALLAIGIIGMLVGDWGRVIRALAERALYDQRSALASRSRLMEGPLPALLDATFSSDQPGGHSGADSALTAPERDILRWLAINGADRAVATVEAMARHLGLSAPIIDAGLLALVRGGYATNVAGRAALSERGASYCVEQGWTMAGGSVSH